MSLPLCAFCGESLKRKKRIVRNPGPNLPKIGWHLDKACYGSDPLSNTYYERAENFLELVREIMTRGPGRAAY